MRRSNKSMRKQLKALLMTVALVTLSTGLIGCNNEKKQQQTTTQVETTENKVENKSSKVNDIDDLFADIDLDSTNKKSEQEVSKKKKNKLSLEDFNDTPAVTQDDDEYDLQKELEAKFDELFGPINND